MIFVFGGFHQGKLDYVFEKYNASESDTFIFDEKSLYIDENKKVLCYIDRYIFALMEENIDALVHIKKMSEKWKDKIIISNDLSSGIVPLDKTYRAYREICSRVNSHLSKESEEVVRIFCGIGSKLK